MLEITKEVSHTPEKVESPTPGQIITTGKLFFLLIVFSILYAGSGYSGTTQNVTDSLMTELEDAGGSTRVDILNQLSKIYEHQIPDSSFYYASQAEILADDLQYTSGKALAKLNKGNYYVRISNYPKALEEYDVAIILFEKVNDKEGLLKSYNNKGNMFRLSGEYDQALFNFLESLRISEEVGHQKGIAYACLNAGLIYSTRLGKSEEQGLPYFFRTLEICREINDQICIAYSIHNIALVYTELKQYNIALDYFQQSLELKQANNDKIGVASSIGSISDIYTLKGEHEISLKYHQQALEIYREENYLPGIVINLNHIGQAYFLHLNQPEKAAPYLEEALLVAENLNSLQIISDTYQNLYQYHRARNDFEKALEFYQLYTTTKDSMYTETSSEQIAQMRTLYETEKKEAAINQLTNEKTIQDLQLRKSENLKWSFIVLSLLTLLLAGFAFYGYRQKQKANVLLNNLNLIEIENKERAISLFGQQVSKEVAQVLLSRSSTPASEKLFTCVMFLDIRDFTPFVEGKEPAEIIQYQNDVFGFMINIISKHNGIIYHFLGDGFMATFGAPVSSQNDCQNAVNASLEIMEMLNKKCDLGEIPRTRVGIGLHAGFIITGNVGTAERKQYSITGNTVILASRIEQLNKEFGTSVLISKEVLDNVDQHKLNTQNLGKVSLKGRSEPLEIIQLI